MKIKKRIHYLHSLEKIDKRALKRHDATRHENVITAAVGERSIRTWQKKRINRGRSQRSRGITVDSARGKKKQLTHPEIYCQASNKIK